jgi:hypothetical protein
MTGNTIVCSFLARRQLVPMTLMFSDLIRDMALHLYEFFRREGKLIIEELRPTSSKNNGSHGGPDVQVTTFSIHRIYLNIRLF